MNAEQFDARVIALMTRINEITAAGDMVAALLAWKELFEFMLKFGPDAQRGEPLEAADPADVKRIAMLFKLIERETGPIGTWH